MTENGEVLGTKWKMVAMRMGDLLWWEALWWGVCTEL